MTPRELRATADHLFDLARQAEADGKPARARALDIVAEDFEAELAWSKAESTFDAVTTAS
jgi:hypothetical protein